jgi:hypothetical protein
MRRPRPRYNPPPLIDIQGFITLLASDAFQGNGDATLTKGKNFYFVDFFAGRKRRYLPWDRDSSLTRRAVDKSIYSAAGPYAVMLDVPDFRAQYNQIFNDLMCGPWAPESLISFLDEIEPILTPVLVTDLNSKFGDASSIAGQFTKLRDWLTDRAAFIVSEIEGYQPCPSFDIVLNEFMAGNAGFLEDPDEPGDYPDWVELYNPTAFAQDLGGLFLTDNALNPTKYQIPFGTIIPAYGYLVFYADRDPEQGPLHASFAAISSRSVT